MKMISKHSVWDTLKGTVLVIYSCMTDYPKTSWFEMTAIS